MDNFLEKIRSEAENSRFAIRASEEGTVLSVGDGIVHVAGLRDARLYELLELEGGDCGIVFDMSEESMGVVLLTETNGAKAGDKVYKTDRIASVAVGESLLGRVVNPLGTPVDGGPSPDRTVSCPVERQAPPLPWRDFVNQPLYTGIRLIDSMLPIGRGQRELIIGDPSTGKTSIGIDAITNQKHSDVISVYVAIGQKKSHVSKIISELGSYGDFSRTVAVVADASDSLGLQYLAPYSATAIAEYFMDRGRDVLVVYDDLTKHADAYRSLSLLLRRPPGREAYPGDIFFIHSRLLERSAKLSQRHGGGSITAIPIVETQQGRISSYIPTNLISITDGQIYLDISLYNKGIRPAIDVGKSVSRIGGKAQVDAMKAVAERLKIDYSRFIEVEVFTKFGAHVEEETARLIRRGERLREILKQPRFRPCSPEEIVVNILILETGILDALELSAVERFCGEIAGRTVSAFPEIMDRISRDGRFGKNEAVKLKDFIAREGGAA
ncbi:MAG TPA: F0F1 ATP synthase subunit alpha [Geobacteraceae bacterium]|nr:F0F1 ATP synthase subunit alpha [Geobacteraceae bacterium]